MKKQIRKIIRHLSLRILAILSLINKITYKSSHTILLFTYNKSFNDNNRALFEYLVQNGYNKKYKIVYAFPEYKEWKKNKKNQNVVYTSCLKSVFVFLYSKYCFYDTGTLKIKPSNKQMVIQLWHGTPLKKLDKTVNTDTVRGDHYDDFTYAVCCAEIVKPILAKAFECSENRILVTGYPRNDNLFNKEDFLYLLNIKKNKYKKVLLWMPTFRIASNGRHIDSIIDEENTTGLQLFTKENDLIELDTFLREHSFYLVIKLHPLSAINNQDYLSFTNLVILNNSKMNKLNIQNYKLMSNFDVLITDYSSVYFDWLLTNKPIGFVIEDIANYSSMRGFAFDNPLQYMPGMKIANKIGFYDFCKSIEEKDSFIKERNEMRQMFNSFTDADSSKRILKLAGITV